MAASAHTESDTETTLGGCIRETSEHKWRTDSTHLQVHSQPLVALGNMEQTTSSYKVSVAVKQHKHRKHCEGIPFLPLPL